MINHSGWQVQDIRIGEFVIPGFAVEPVAALLVVGALAVLALLTLIVMIWRSGRRRARAEAAQLDTARMFETEVAELKGRLHAMAELSVTRQSELSRALHERLDRMGANLGTGLEETARKTSDHLSRLHERLAVIDSAQRNIAELSTRVVSLQDILANKQQRGAFGQLRMETIVQDGLPRGSYSFQATLSNGRRPDCLVHLPGSAAGIVIDAKFPLEGFEALRSAHEEQPRREAMRRVRVDVGRHIDDIAGKYALPGETQDTLLMFVPSESIYAELHEHFPDMLQKAHRARVVIVSPNMLMLAVQTMQAIMKDVRMREQAGLIQTEVGALMQDVNRLRERVADLQRHFGLANADVEKILTSADKIASRGRKIEAVELDGGGNAAAVANGANEDGATAPIAANGDGRLAL